MLILLVWDFKFVCFLGFGFWGLSWVGGVLVRWVCCGLVFCLFCCSGCLGVTDWVLWVLFCCLGGGLGCGFGVDGWRFVGFVGFCMWWFRGVLDLGFVPVWGCWGLWVLDLGPLGVLRFGFCICGLLGVWVFCGVSGLAVVGFCFLFVLSLLFCVYIVYLGVGLGGLLGV